MLRDDSFDFCFTSPPYFDLEHYSTDDTQSFIKYNRYETWRNLFLNTCIKNLYRVLKPGSKLLINIGKTQKHNIPEDCKELCIKAGFNLLETRYISFPTYKYTKSSSAERLEPLFVFEKP